MLLEKLRSKYFILLWTIMRVYLGIQWLLAGWNKIGGKFDSTDFIKQSISMVNGKYPSVESWYAFFLEQVILPNIHLVNIIVPWTEFTIGLCLIFGFFTSISLYISAFMNLNFMLAGAVAPNPVLFTFAIILIVLIPESYRIGIDYYALPSLKEVFIKDYRAKL